jgi:hypothetical protein
MKRNQIRLNLPVYDRWYIEWGIGRIVKILKTRIHIQFSHKLMKYDNSHLQFLEIMK